MSHRGIGQCLVISLLSLLLLFLGHWMLPENLKPANYEQIQAQKALEDQRKQQELRNVQLAWADPWTYRQCEWHPENIIPVKHGFFCATLRKGVPVKVRAPMGVTFVYRITDPSQHHTLVQFFDEYGKIIPGKDAVYKNEENHICAPTNAWSLQLTLLKEAVKDEGTLRVLIGQGATLKNKNCS